MPARRPKGEGSISYDATRDRYIGRLPKSAILDSTLPTSVVGPNKTVAAERLRALRTEHTNSLASKRYEPVTIAELIKKFEATRTRKKVAAAPLKTKSNNEWALKKINQVLADRKANDLRVADIDNALTALHASGVKSINSLGRVREVMAQLFDFAIDRDWCERNPADRASLPDDAAQPRKGIALDPDQCVRILGELEENPHYAMWVAQIYQALRPGEAAGLTLDDPDFDEMTLWIRNSIRYDDGGKPDEIAPVKTGNEGRGRRKLRMAPAVAEALKKRIEARELQKAVYGENWPKEWERVIFVTNTGKPPNANVLSKPFKEACEAIGVKGARRYDTRHSAATMLAEQGLTLEQIADVMGHEDTRMAREIYVKLKEGRVLDGIVDLSPPVEPQK